MTPTRIRSRSRTLNLPPPLTFAQDLELLRCDEEALPAAVRLLVELRLRRKELLRDLAREMHALARQPGACQARRELFGFGWWWWCW